MKKLTLLFIVLLSGFVVLAQAQMSPTGQGATVLNGGIPTGTTVAPPGAGPNNLGGPGLGRHDLMNANTNSPLGCETCHLPHTAPPANGAAFLWAWNVVPNTITTYITDTNPAGSADLVGPPTRTGASSRSLLCLSCHDSTSANANGITGGVSLNGSPWPIVTTTGGVGSMGTEHPVNALVPATLDYQIVSPAAGLADAATASIGPDGLPLWGNDYRVQCTSCHDQHNDYQSDMGAAGGPPFLRVANTNGTALCRECHNK